MELDGQAWAILRTAAGGDETVRFAGTEDADLRNAAELLLAEGFISLDSVVQLGGGVSRIYRLSDEGRDLVAFVQPSGYVERMLAVPVRTGNQKGRFVTYVSGSGLVELTELQGALSRRLYPSAQPLPTPYQPDEERDQEDQYKLEQVEKWIASPKWRKRR